MNSEMSDNHRMNSNLPPEQEAIREKCFHSTGTVVEFPIEDVETSIPARFEKIVRKHANRLAVKMGDESLTYDELNRYANRIAHTILDRRGPGSEPIGLFFDNSVDLIAAIFGVLKAGKFYVVLDPLFPEERLQHLLNDSGTKLVVTDRYHRNAASKLTGKDRALLTVEITDNTQSSENPNIRVFAHELACIQYTSGSTGTPKGVVQLHENVLQSVRWMTEEIQVHTDDRFSLLHSLSFASGYTNLRLALLNGASVFGFDTKRENIEQLGRWLRDERITILHSPPALFRQLAESLPSGGIHADLRLIRLSGAPITRRDFELYKSRFVSGVRLHIGMGSTEARGICAAIVDHSFLFPTEGSPIGYPPPAKKILFFDETGQEVARGQVGEIVVKGQNLNSRYWRESTPTNDRFLPNPEGGDQKIFWTGDLGRILPDGFVVHLGRKHSMVKIRGYRVDVSEVERALLEHPGIKEAGVRAWDREEGEKYLAGYIVPRPESVLNASEVRKFLSNKLPDYMIPTALKFVETLPLTNGKLDRLALRKPDTRRPELKETYVAPRNEVERKLAGTWSEVLQIDDIGVHDNFFDLGGHSLTASRVLSRVLDCFRVEVSLRSFFESPTLTGLARNVENALRQGPSETNLPLVRAPRDRHLPASFGQRALWFHDQLEPGSCAYNLVFSYRFSGELDVQLMEQSINQIVARHEVLRTVFEAVDGRPVQNILPVMTIGLEVIDLSNLVAESLQDSEVRRFAGVLAEQSFDLTRGPLLRLALLRLASNEYVFFLAVHHIVFDGWSIGVFSRELSQIYNSLRSGKPCPFPELRIQYADFSMWQRERLRDANLQNSLSYWKTQLDNLPTLMLPIKRVQHIPERASGGREEFEVSDELMDLLRSLANRSGTTLFMVLLTAWKVALYRYTGQTDITIGTPVAGRNHPAVEELIGYFLNLVVLRSDLSGDPTVHELLDRIRRVCIDAFSHQDVPFEKLVEELRPTRHVTTNPLVQATFALQNNPKQSLNLTGIAVRDLDISAGVARPFDLHLYMIEEETCLRGYVSYNKNLFETDTVRRLIDHLKNLLKAIAANQDQRISAFPMMTDEETHQLLVEWNDTKTDYAKEKCIHELFEAQVEKTPDAIAITFENHQVTYRGLNQRANQLAHYLRRRGVRPDDLVSLFMERSPEMVIAILGVLKAGGAYLPIDPNLPAERIQFLLTDAQVELILTQDKLQAALGDFSGEVFCLDNDRSNLSDENQENPRPTALGHHAAYVIYTSGSAAVPKGVINIHDGLRNRIQWMQQNYRLSALDRVLQKTPYTFDVSVWEFLWPLTSGASLVLAQPGGQRDSAHLVELIKSWQITTLHFVPSMLGIFLQEPGFEQCSSLRQVFCSGEALSYEVQQNFFERSAAVLHNLYGPTEASIDVTAWQCRRDYAAKVVPIGRPIANTQIYILDEYLVPVPIGVVGEIHIGGDGLARGYLNQPELTAEKFIYHSFNGEPARRLYKTGDLARYLPDGNIEFLGRVDNQVKIRGYRIELGEIEAVLAQHPSIQHAVVLAREDSPGERRLVAYVVTAPGTTTSATELRSALRQKLPDYMLPSAIVLLDSLPLTPNGKLDRKALPAPDQNRPELDETYTAPRTPTEDILAKIWAEVLKIEKVGIQDNFFNLGGHSLLATQVVSRIRDPFQMDIPLRTLFEKPTVEELAIAIMHHSREQISEKELSGILNDLESLSKDELKQRLV
jgi:amino acid adenylation domain-containing protein